MRGPPGVLDAPHFLPPLPWEAASIRVGELCLGEERTDSCPILSLLNAPARVLRVLGVAAPDSRRRSGEGGRGLEAVWPGKMQNWSRVCCGLGQVQARRA